jgi:hypothetical protein
VLLVLSKTLVVIITIISMSNITPIDNAGVLLGCWLSGWLVGGMVCGTSQALEKGRKGC